MNKFKILLGVLVFSSMVSMAQAASVSRLPASSENQEKQFSVSVRTDFILNREDSDGDEYGMNTYEAEAGYRFNDRIRVYVTGGMAKIEYDADSTETDNDPIFGIGTTIRAFETDDHIALDLDAKYKYMNTEFTSSLYPGIAVDAEIGEWQAALTASKSFLLSDEDKVDSITPYLGVKYNDFDSNGSFAGIGLGDYSADQVVGVYGGLDIAFNSSVALGLQGRLIDEEAVMVDVNFRF